MKRTRKPLTPEHRAKISEARKRVAAQKRASALKPLSVLARAIKAAQTNSTVAITVPLEKQDYEYLSLVSSEHSIDLSVLTAALVRVALRGE